MNPLSPVVILLRHVHGKCLLYRLAHMPACLPNYMVYVSLHIVSAWVQLWLCVLWIWQCFSTAHGSWPQDSHRHWAADCVLCSVCISAHNKKKKKKTQKLLGEIQVVMPTSARVHILISPYWFFPQGRQKLARFNAREFATLIIDILSDAKRRQQGKGLSSPTGETGMKEFTDWDSLPASVALPSLNRSTVVRLNFIRNIFLQQL